MLGPFARIPVRVLQEHLSTPGLAGGALKRMRIKHVQVLKLRNPRETLDRPTRILVASPFQQLLVPVTTSRQSIRVPLPPQEQYPLYGSYMVLVSRLELGPQQKNIFLAWLVENIWTPKSKKKQGELILGKVYDMYRYPRRISQGGKGIPACTKHEGAQQALQLTMISVGYAGAI